MNYQMIKRWNSVIKADSIVWHLGDFSFGSNDQIESIFRALNGKKRIILGNHDHKKRNFLKTLFEYVYDKPVIYDNYILSHRPILMDIGELKNAHGHIHQYPSPTKNHINVSCEQIDYTPIKFKNVIKIVS